jgi:hypothetical protein
MQQAIISLRQALEDYSSTAKHQSEQINILASVLSMTTVEAFRGGHGAWSLHLEGARKFLQSAGGYRVWLRRNSDSSTLCQVYDCLDTLRATKENWKANTATDEYKVSTTSGSPDTNPLFSETALSRKQLFAESNSYSLDVTYGISLPTLLDIRQTNELVKLLNSLEALDYLPADVQTTIDRISTSLHRFSHTTDLPRHDSLFDADISFMCLGQLSSPIAQELMEHHCWAFHFAAILYFNRAVSRYRQTTHREQQWLASQVLDHLETLDSLSDEDGHPVTLWPALVAGCESADPALRRRVISFLARNRRFGLGNMNVAKGVILEAWRRMSRFGSENEAATAKLSTKCITPVDWREIMHDLNADIVLA